MAPGGHRLAELAAFVERVVRAESIQELEQQYLDGIGTFIAGAASGIYLHDSLTQKPESFAAQGVSDYYLARYERLGRERDPVLDHALESGVAVDNLMLMSPREWIALPVYRDVFRLHGMVSVLIAPIVVDAEIGGTLNFARTEQQPGFSDDERTTAETLGRLFAVALPTARSSIAVTRDRQRLLEALDLSGTSVVITDTANASRTMNPVAVVLLARVVDGEARFEELTTGLGQGGSATATVDLVTGGKGRLQVHTVLLNSDDAVTTTFVQLSVPGEERLTPAVERVLSGRERDVCALAAAGLHDGEIAARLYLSHHTVKQHLKSAYAKLGIRSRVELARLDTSFAAPPS